MSSRRAFIQSAITTVVGLAGASRLFGMNRPRASDRPTNSTPLPVITPERFVHSRTQSATHALRERDRLIDALEHAWISSIALSGFPPGRRIYDCGFDGLGHAHTHDGTNKINGSAFQSVRQALRFSIETQS
jgi:hypothetical protein